MKPYCESSKNRPSFKVGAVSLGAVAFALCFSSCQSAGNIEKKDPYRVVKVEEGKASWYSVKTNYGTRTASGIPLCDTRATAAHKKLPFGTKVRVTNLNNQMSEIVTITDRGPFIHGRVIDVSVGTANKIQMYRSGVVNCKVEVLEEVAPNAI